ncbi:hypothetical protein CEXT_349631 [Caerostris extrusa]|uniref:Uncharacterized protein n=1 Tax=Caerostris extrusa TaxID=172846 RepID=A0AAV4XI67_CAEEX|nr:hypothetical protein CEXT_349631 [Caerostris extrusa]
MQMQEKCPLFPLAKYFIIVFRRVFDQQLRAFFESKQKLEAAKRHVAFLDDVAFLVISPILNTASITCQCRQSIPERIFLLLDTHLSSSNMST